MPLVVNPLLRDGFFTLTSDPYPPGPPPMASGLQSVASKSSAEHGDGERMTFEQVFREHRNALLAFLRRRTGNEDDAQEAVQECYLRLLQYDFSQPRPPHLWKALLFRIAANHATNLARGARTHYANGHKPLEQVELACEAPSQERQIAAQQDLVLLMQAVRRLTPRCRQVFLLSRVHGKTHAQIAAHCGISVKMVEKHICTALAACRATVGVTKGTVS